MQKWCFGGLLALMLVRSVSAVDLITVEEAGAVLDSYAVSPKHGVHLFPEAEHLNNVGIAGYLSFYYQLTGYRLIAVPDTVIYYHGQYITRVLLTDLNRNELNADVFDLWVSKGLVHHLDFNVTADSPDYQWAIVVSEKPINDIFTVEFLQDQELGFSK